MDIKGKAEVLVMYIQSLADFQFVDIDRDYNHMGAAITDAILQSGINYDNVVRPRVRKMREQHPEAATVTGFVNLLQQEGPNRLLNWEGRKPVWVQSLALFLQAEQIETEPELNRWIQLRGNIDRLKKLNGIGVKTADYLGSLVNVDTVAIDQHLRKFVDDAGVIAKDDAEVKRVIETAATLLEISRINIDRSIWRFMARKKPRGC